MALIHFKIASICSKIRPVAKNSVNKDDGYKFRSIYDIYNELNPLFKTEGIFFSLKVLESSETIVQTNKGRAFRVKVKVEWTLSCSDGSTIQEVTIGEGIDSSDKASNKAITASLKYLLIYKFLIPTAHYETDADFSSPTIMPFEDEGSKKTNSEPKPKSLLALCESKNISRTQMLEIGKQLNIDIEAELSPENRKKLYEAISKLKG